MSTENENWNENAPAAENSGAEKDGNQFNNENVYNRPSYNRENGDRPYRPRFNNDNGERPQRPAYGDRQGGYRPQRPRFNNMNGDRQGGYRPRYNQGDDGQRPYNNDRQGYRPRYNDNGDRPQRPYNNDRPRQPRPYNNDRYNNGGGYDNRGYNNDRQGGYRPRYNDNGDGGYRPRYNDNGGDGGYRPRYNNGGGYDNRGYNNGGRPNQYGNKRPMRRPNQNYNPNAKFNKKKQIEYKEQFIDPNEPIRLNKYLANAGVCSRREADEFITAGVVSVNGTVVTELGTKIKRGDEVKFHDQVISIERKIYVLLNKPKNTVTTSDDPQERRTVLDLVKGACTERIYPVGRLDRNTTGVLLLTNDGDLASKLTHPQYMKKKIYHVHLDKNLTQADMEQIATGIQLDDGEIHADEISYTDEAKKDDIGIEIHSGKNRIVRRIFEALGYKVTKLDRVYFAGLTKKGLRRGDWRFLTEQEVNFLRMGSFE